MTAPDVNADVRARFEAWFAKACPTTDAQAREGIIGATTCRNFAFKAWKAAHADIAGEVRELVEALDGIRQYGSDTLSGNAEGPTDRDWFRDGMRELTRRARTALAKHTHQEKK